MFLLNIMLFLVIVFIAIWSKSIGISIFKVILGAILAGFGATGLSYGIFKTKQQKIKARALANTVLTTKKQEELKSIVERKEALLQELKSVLRRIDSIN